MAIAPDTKDWTWVIEEPCPECGFDPTTVSRDNLVPRMTSALEAWSAVPTRDDVDARPDADTWSPGEYAAHIVDVCAVMADRIALILNEDDPEFANWDQDQAAIDGDYATADTAQLVPELCAAAAHLAAAYDAVKPTEWERTGLRSNGSAFTVLSLGQYLLHDLAHHLHDVGTSWQQAKDAQA